MRSARLRATFQASQMSSSFRRTPVTPVAHAQQALRILHVHDGQAEVVFLRADFEDADTVKRRARGIGPIGVTVASDTNTLTESPTPTPSVCASSLPSTML